jgi:hypothetical protein
MSFTTLSKARVQCTYFHQPKETVCKEFLCGGGGGFGHTSGHNHELHSEYLETEHNYTINMTELKQDITCINSLGVKIHTSKQFALLPAAAACSVYVTLTLIFT